MALLADRHSDMRQMTQASFDVEHQAQRVVMAAGLAMTIDAKDDSITAVSPLLNLEAHVSPDTEDKSVLIGPVDASHLVLVCVYPGHTTADAFDVQGSPSDTDDVWLSLRAAPSAEGYSTGCHRRIRVIYNRRNPGTAAYKVYLNGRGA